MSIMLIDRSTSKQVGLDFHCIVVKLFSVLALTVLNHAGIFLSYNATLMYMKRLVDQADYPAQVKQGRWLWVYDNFNMHQTIRHERQGIFPSHFVWCMFLLNVLCRHAQHHGKCHHKDRGQNKAPASI